MKKIIILIIVTTLFSMCSVNKLNQKVLDKRFNKEVLIGVCNRAGLKKAPNGNWFEKEYTAYKVDAASLEAIQAKQTDKLKIITVLGTWCSDSRREVPRFYKILDKLAFSEKKMKVICIDGKKQADIADLKNWNIERVPTFIFYRNGKEIGRIIETPNESLEKDLAKILLF